MRTKQRLFERLDRSEADLRQELVPALRRTAAGLDDMLFITSTTNPWPQEGWLRSHTSKGGEALLAKAQEILELAHQLGQPVDDLLATKVVRLFAAATDLTNHNRKGPRGIARDFLLELGENA